MENAIEKECRPRQPYCGSTKTGNLHFVSVIGPAKTANRIFVELSLSARPSKENPMPPPGASKARLPSWFLAKCDPLKCCLSIEILPPAKREAVRLARNAVKRCCVLV